MRLSVSVNVEVEGRKLSLEEVVFLDWKETRHSYDKGVVRGAIHTVSTWASENQLVLGQVKVADKSNEITAIPKLLNILDISGCIVTIDAMGAQTEVAKHIIDQGADYVLSLKGNQGSLHEDVEQLFELNPYREFGGEQHRK